MAASSKWLLVSPHSSARPAAELEGRSSVERVVVDRTAGFGLQDTGSAPEVEPSEPDSDRAGLVPMTLMVREPGWEEQVEVRSHAVNYLPMDG